MPADIGNDLKEKIAELIFSQNKVGAILLYRETSNASLKRSKEFVENLETQLRTESPEKFYGYSRNVSDEFSNFSLEGIFLEIAGQILDLHNHFKLQGYTYKTPLRIFELDFHGEIFYSTPKHGSKVQAELTLNFRDVDFLRIQDEPLDEGNVSFVSMKRVGNMCPKPEMVLQVDQERIKRNLVRPDGTYNENATSEIDWNKYFYIHFVWGVEILISAATVEANLHQKIGVDR